MKSLHILTFAFFFFCFLALYSASTLYHGLKVSEKKLFILNKIDHVMIFVLIAATYTPICLVVLKGAWGWSIFASVWGIALFGSIDSGQLGQGGHHVGEAPEVIADATGGDLAGPANDHRQLDTTLVATAFKSRPAASTVKNITGLACAPLVYCQVSTLAFGVAILSVAGFGAVVHFVAVVCGEHDDGFLIQSQYFKFFHDQL